MLSHPICHLILQIKKISHISSPLDRKVKRSRQGALYLPSQKINHVYPHPPFKKNIYPHLPILQRKAVTPKSPSIFCLKEMSPILQRSSHAQISIYLLSQRKCHVYPHNKIPSTCKGLLFRYYIYPPSNVFQPAGEPPNLFLDCFSLMVMQFRTDCFFSW